MTLVEKNKEAGLRVMHVEGWNDLYEVYLTEAMQKHLKNAELTLKLLDLYFKKTLPLILDISGTL